ncbi:MAG: hypothetical protein ACR2IP_10730 [Solirubrobacteraceae bacterium]
MSWRLNPEQFCTEEGCTRPRALGSDLCLACAQGVGPMHRHMAEREEEPPAPTIDLENWPVLPEH